MTAALFLGFLGMMTVIIVAIVARYLHLRTALGVLAGVRVVHLCRPVGILRCCQKHGDASPGITFIVVPVI